MLKQLIQRLLDSRTTAAEAAHSAMPKPEAPTIVSDPVTDKAWHSLIAPFDGYFSCKGITKHMLIENSAAQWSGVTGLTSGGYMGFTLPMSKGSEVRYQLDHNSTGVMLTFSKTIGGGYNHFVRRALSCLRPSFNYLPRSFCKINIPTLLINADQVPVHKARQSQETARRISWLHSQVGQSLRLAQTVRQTTHGLGLKTPLEERHTSPMQFANTKRLLSQCKKEMFLLLTSALITRTKAPFCLSLLKQQNNLGTGGVTC